MEIGGDMSLVLSTSNDGIEIQRNASIFKMNLVKRVFSGLMEQWFDGIASGIKDASMIILSATSVLAGLSCIEKFPSLKTVSIYTFPCIRTSAFAPPALSGNSTSLFGWINLLKWKMFAYGASNIYTEVINRCRAKLNLLPIKLDYDQMVRSVLKKPMLTATIYSPSLLNRPSDWPPTDLMVGPIFSEDEDEKYSPSDELIAFLEKRSDEKLIYIGVGSMMKMMFSTDEQMVFLRQIQRSLAENTCKALVSLVGFTNLDRQTITNTEKILYLTESVPHNWLFPRISAVVHHGGAGTTHAGLIAGLPTLVIPFGADQPFNGDRIFIHRLGPKPIPVRTINQRNLTEAIRNLIDNLAVYQIQTKKIAESMKKENGLISCLEMINKELQS